MVTKVLFLLGICGSLLTGGNRMSDRKDDQRVGVFVGNFSVWITVK